MTERVVKIYDTTLRDGLRNSGAILIVARECLIASSKLPMASKAAAKLLWAFAWFGLAFIALR